MQAQSICPVKTFSIGFSETGYDEAVHAKAVAKHLRTDHTEWYVTPQDTLDVIPSLPTIYDEPFGDASQIPTHLVARLAREHVTVCLSGDGGDELFGGYNRYFWGPSLWNKLNLFPKGLKHFAANILIATSPSMWNSLGVRLPHRFRQPLLGDKVHKIAGVFGADGPDQLYIQLISQQHEVSSIVIGGTPKISWGMAEGDKFAFGVRGDNVIDRMMFRDLVGYLPDDILTKVDRAAMAASLETRIPLLDHGLVEFAWSLPMRMKIRHGQGKWLLRQVLYRYVPRRLIERPKQGFSVPIDHWLRGPLKDWAESLIDEGRLRREGLLQPEPVRKKWEEHLSGQRNWQYWLWNVLMFQAWHEHWCSKK